MIVMTVGDHRSIDGGDIYSELFGVADKGIVRPDVKKELMLFGFDIKREPSCLSRRGPG